MHPDDEERYAMWEWSVMDKQYFKLISKHGMSLNFVRAAEEAIMNIIGKRTGRWISHVETRVKQSTSTDLTITMKRMRDGETIDVRIPNFGIIVPMKTK